MLIIDYLTSLYRGKDPEEIEAALNKLFVLHGVKSKIYPDLVVLNYGASSDMKDPLVKECRSLILTLGTWEIVSRSFDRFPNYPISEDPDTDCEEDLDWNKVKVFEKRDGSLIKIYYWNKMWHIASRGMAFAEGTVNKSKTTYAELVLKALKMSPEEFQRNCSHLDPDVTYIFEITTPEHQIVVFYPDRQLTYLSARRKDGTYVYEEGWKSVQTLTQYRAELIEFESIHECLKSAEKLGKDYEGYVIYENDIPRFKVKGDEYMYAYAHSNGQRRCDYTCINPMEIVLNGEQEELIPYFAEDRIEIERLTREFNIMCDRLDMLDFKKMSNKELKKNHQSNLYYPVLAVMLGRNSPARRTFLEILPITKRKEIFQVYLDGNEVKL